MADADEVEAERTARSQAEHAWGGDVYDDTRQVPYTRLADIIELDADTAMPTAKKNQVNLYAVLLSCSIPKRTTSTQASHKFSLTLHLLDPSCRFVMA